MRCRFPCHPSPLPFHGRSYLHGLLASWQTGSCVRVCAPGSMRAPARLRPGLLRLALRHLPAFFRRLRAQSLLACDHSLRRLAHRWVGRPATTALRRQTALSRPHLPREPRLAAATGPATRLTALPLGSQSAAAVAFLPASIVALARRSVPAWCGVLPSSTACSHVPPNVVPGSGATSRLALFYQHLPTPATDTFPAK